MSKKVLLFPESATAGIPIKDFLENRT